MTYTEAIVLMLLKKIERERTPAAVFHLLKGKRSAQTIQDAHLFSMEKWFQAAPFLRMDSYGRLIERLGQNGLIKQAEQSVTVLPVGMEAALDTLGAADPFPHLSGWYHAKAAPLFFRRLQLTVQVVSNLAYRERFYYPVIRDESIQYWVKQYVKRFGDEKASLPARLHDELLTVFEALPEHPDCLLLRLSGRTQTGLTARQAAEQMKMAHDEYWFRFLHALHAMCSAAAQNRDSVPLLHTMIADVAGEVPLTASAQHTAALLKRGMSPAAIASARSLRLSTVEDHVVEVALNDSSFSIRPYVSEAQEHDIKQAGGTSDTRKLKPLKEQLPDISYFQIRLVLAKESRRKV